MRLDHMIPFALVAATVVGSLSDSDVILVNDTGLVIARLEIDGKKYEAFDDGGNTQPGKILMTITPTKHHLKLVFRGGADAEWPHFDFKGVHEIFFERVHNKIQARVQ